MTRPCGPALVTLVDGWLRAHLSYERVECCFIYGSVARASDTQTSDLDTLLITTTDLPPYVVDALKISYSDFQRSVAFVPDPMYPLEIRSLRSCYAELTAIDNPAIKGTDFAEGGLADAAELLRALTDQRITIRNNGCIEILTRLAEGIRAKLGCTL
jgi:hypothetical protein